MDDPISKQMAIDALAKEMPRLTTPDGSGQFDREIQIADEAFVDCMTIINELPVIDIPRWIPCSERLPEEDTDVLIAYRYKEGEGDTTHSYIEITSYGDMYFGGNPVHESGTGNRVKHWRPPFAYFVSNYEVIAWMPLPEPYKEETDE